ncbi:alginate O-acetyltransferase AlgX-related protein [Prosthecobacter dejongeii]|uniref:AlgX/AlgJ SGNH hydrolase-like domain-containing protein n=1 Tax=Prosthecobacter dejongeii TaxID=48465 RepID=A0A7W8DS96_9BACT|nr:hypothetical protein [Prosthecobacter dejongeii]MBB5040413.1 hypothetical protein [Prosthecobacter dejongeii]
MMDDPLNFTRIFPLLLAGGFAAFPRQFGPWAFGTAFARMGLGFAKLMFLALNLESLYTLCVNAAPEAASSWSAFIGMVAFTGCLYMMFTGTADVWVGLMRLLRVEMPEIIRHPFGARGFVDFWNRWGVLPVNHVPTASSALLRCGLLVLCLLIAQGFSYGLLLWLLLQACLIGLDSWLGRTSGWMGKIPRWIKSILTIAAFTLSTPLLYGGGWEVAMQEWSRLFSASPETVYSVFLDARLTAPQVCWLLWISVLAALVLPGFPWWMARGPRLRLAAKGAGFLCFGAVILFVITFIESAPSPLIRAGEWLHRVSSQAGSHGVHQGIGGWLYADTDLYRLTQKRHTPGQVEDILSLQKQLQSQGSPLLLLPIPDKIGLRPEPILPARYKGAVHPLGYHASIQRLKSAGVDVLDMSEKLWDQRNRLPLHFHQDTLWTAEAMKEIAVQASRHIRKAYPQVVLDETPLVDAQFIERQDFGDLARRLHRQPESFWPAETTQMVGLRGLTGAETSPVLVIGGDLVRAYDDPSLSFPPTSLTDPPAGFPTQLGALLGRALDVAEAAPAATLVPRMSGKKLIIWVVRAGEL